MMTTPNDQASKFVNWLKTSLGIGTMPQPVPEAQSLNRIRFANTLRVSGEAAKVTVLIGQPSNTDLAKISDEFKQQLRRSAEKETAHIEASRKYHVEEMALKNSSIVFHIYAHDNNPSPFRAALDANQGEQWVTAVNAFQEKLRKQVKVVLIRALKDYGEVSISSSWEPGQGVLASGGVVENGDSSRALEEELWALRIRREYLKRRMILAGGASIGTLVLILSVIVLLRIVSYPYIAQDEFTRSTLWNDPFVVGAGAYGLMFFLFFALAFIQTRGAFGRVREEIRDVLAKIDLLGVTDEKQKHAYKLFQLNNGELKRYYDLALRQRGWVFIVGVLCILAGFVVIIWAIQAISSLPPDRALEEKIVIAILGGAGGILANFVAAIFMKMFSEIVGSTVEFHLRLVGTHHAHFGNVLAAKIQNSDLADQTLARLAIALGSPATSSPEKAATEVMGSHPEKSPQTPKDPR